MEEMLASADEHSQWIYEVINLSLFFGGLLAALMLGLFHRRNPPDRPELTASIAGRSWSSLQVGILVGSLFLLYFLAMFSGRLFYEDQIPVAKLVITILIYSILVSVIAIINRVRGGNMAASCGMGLRELKLSVIAPLLYLAFIPFLMIAAKGWHLLLQLLFEMEVELQEVAQVIAQDLSWLQIAYMCTAIFIAPVYEELMFRGIVFPYLVKRTGLAGGTALVSLLFAMMHFHLPSFLPLYLLSVVLCLAYWRTGSLWVSIGIHTVFNAVSILALNLVG